MHFSWVWVENIHIREIERNKYYLFSIVYIFVLSMRIDWKGKHPHGGEPTTLITKSILG